MRRQSAPASRPTASRSAYPWEPGSVAHSAPWGCNSTQRNFTDDAETPRGTPQGPSSASHGLVHAGGWGSLHGRCRMWPTTVPDGPPRKWGSGSDQRLMVRTGLPPPTPAQMTNVFTALGFTHHVCRCSSCSSNLHFLMPHAVDVSHCLKQQGRPDPVLHLRMNSSSSIDPLPWRVSPPWRKPVDVVKKHELWSKM